MKLRLLKKGDHWGWSDLIHLGPGWIIKNISKDAFKTNTTDTVYSNKIFYNNIVNKHGWILKN